MLFQAPMPFQRRQLAFILLSAGLFCGFGMTASRGASFAEAQKLYLTGEYSECISEAKAGAAAEPRDEDWPILLSKCLLTTGDYSGAQTVVSNALFRIPGSIRVRLAARDAYLQNGDTNRAHELLEEINDRVSTRAWNYRDSANMVAIGKAALLLGADARRVLDNFFNRVKKAEPGFRETYLAIGQLALDKFDQDLAAKTYEEGLKKFPDDTEMLYGLAKSYSTGDRAQMIPLIEKLLELNERHPPSLLLLADHLIDAEEYKKADEMLDKVIAVNAKHPEAWAYRAVLAHLRNQPEQENKARGTALALWKTNPQVDYIIGQKLSQKYRFVEGSGYQRRALQSSENYLPAKDQLAQDLLRLGDEDEGWALAEDVYKQDGYDVAAYNLVTLHDTLVKFQILTNADFRVRMHPHEAAVYGPRVLELLGRAKKVLTEKYGMTLPRQTVVEIFPEQKDFAIRTFGMPGGAGFLGVCFGNVITANSPASHAASRINWESVLWHEFCHVITLGMTKNKMPRWLSEGISVYEERQADRSWGQGMTPRYREMVLKGELTPVGNLSAAFLSPKTPFHLQFAYYESSLVVEFLVDRFGLNSLKQILQDLGEGKSINQAIEDRTAPLSQIEKDFASFAKQRAEQLAPGMDWSEPPPEVLASGQEEDWMKKHPKSLWALREEGKKLLREKKWEEAKVPLQNLLELYPDDAGGESAYVLLAQAYRGLKDAAQEQIALSKIARLDSDALEAYQRLMEIQTAANDWPAVRKNAERFLAVNPLVALPYRYLARSSEEQGDNPQAIHSYETMLLLDPPDPADLHYRLARLLHKTGDAKAKRQVLQALEEAPRFRQAHQLLLEIAGKDVPAETEKQLEESKLPAQPSAPKTTLE